MRQLYLLTFLTVITIICGMKKIDSHVHFGPATAEQSIEQLYQKMLQDMDGSGVDKIAILVAENLDHPERFCLNEGLWFRDKQPERTYLFGGLRFDGFDANKPDESAAQLVTELEELFALGCDGIKLLFGKTGYRKKLGVPLDDPIYTPLFNRLEEKRFPIVWHIADPAEFWDSNSDPAPLWGSSQNWCYDDSYPSYESIKAEAETLFDRHPDLNLILPHFYFMSGDLTAAAKFLDKHPNINFDTAPGVEMCHNCSGKVDEAREFFVKYDSRMLFGTDCGMCNHMTSLSRSQMMQDWLETDKEILVPVDDPFMMPDVKDRFNGLALPEDSLKKIYSENFIRVLGQ